MLYRRGGKWWFKFRFAGRVFREPAKTASKKLARDAERKRRQQLEEGYHGLKKRHAPQTFKTAAAAWLEMKQPTVAPKTNRIDKTHLAHIVPMLGPKLISDIEPDDISRYQQHRLREKAAPKTVNLEVGTIRAILRRHRLWANVQPDVRMLSVREDVGKALTATDQKRLIDGCADSRSRSLLPAVLLALNTGMRDSELRLLRWEQVDFQRRTVRVGKSKTEAGTDRVIPLNDKAAKVLKFWADLFPDRKPTDFTFPSERYGAGGDDFEPTVFDVDPETPIGSWKESWESVKRRTGVVVRFHDLRHTCVTRMLEGGVPLSVVGSILGWSPATTARMAKRYGHIGQIAQRQAVAVLDRVARTRGRIGRPARGRKKTVGRMPRRSRLVEDGSHSPKGVHGQERNDQNR